MTAGQLVRRLKNVRLTLIVLLLIFLLLIKYIYITWCQEMGVSDQPLAFKELT